MSLFEKKSPKAEQNNGLSNLDWESDMTLHGRQSEQKAWRLLYGAAVIIGLLALAIIVMTPLKSTVPYVYVVDKLTGEVSVGATAKDFVRTSELNDKYWVKQFMLAHERYNFRLLQSDYDTVQLLSDSPVFSQYAARFDGPNALDKRLGDSIQMIPSIISLSITDGKLATVRFEKRTQDMRPGGETKVTRWVALVRYEYKTLLSRQESELIQNPLGFTVVGYQVDPELVGENIGGR